MIDILTRFSIYNKKVGYVQGMNYIAASLFMHFKDKKKTFIALCALMEQYGLQELYQTGFSKLKNIFLRIEQIVGKMFPNINKIFEDNGITSELFCTQWVMTAFTADLMFL